MVGHHLRHKPPSKGGGEAFESAAQAINQRKRYDKALTLFDDVQDDRIEELLAQKTSSAPQTKKTFNIIPAAAE
jgi:hypothetical protein